MRTYVLKFNSRIDSLGHKRGLAVTVEFPTLSKQFVKYQLIVFWEKGEKDNVSN